MEASLNNGKVTKVAATIWKFSFRISNRVGIEMPRMSRILHVECQQGVPCVWALVNPASEKAIHRFRLLGTGYSISETLGTHVGTFQQGPFVWHMFEESV